MLQLYRSNNFYWCQLTEVPGKTADMSQVTDKQVHLAMSGLKLTIFVVIGTDKIGSKSNYRSPNAKPLVRSPVSYGILNPGSIYL